MDVYYFPMERLPEIMNKFTSQDKNIKAIDTNFDHRFKEFLSKVKMDN